MLELTCTRLLETIRLTVEIHRVSLLRVILAIMAVAVGRLEDIASMAVVALVAIVIMGVTPAVIATTIVVTPAVAVATDIPIRPSLLKLITFLEAVRKIHLHSTHIREKKVGFV
jgi:hypothetical protein